MNVKLLDPRPVLVSDIDGVSLRWSSRLIPFLESRNYPISKEIYDFVNHNIFYNLNNLNNDFDGNFLDAYHSSEFGGDLDPVSSDVTRILPALSKKYRIIALTAFSENQEIIKNRVRNLEKHFPNVFSECISIDPFASKEESLRELDQKYNVRLFVDDRKKHIEEAHLVFSDKTKAFHLQEYSDWNKIYELLK